MPVDERTALDAIVQNETLSPDEKKRAIQDHFTRAVERFFIFELSRPELLNRIGKNIVPFNYIHTPEVQREIVSSHLRRIRDDFADKYRAAEHRLERIYPFPQRAPYLCCRSCSGADDLMRDVREVVAILDSSRQGPEFVQTNGTVRVHWRQRAALFDFDRIEIAQASDYDVERFCMQVGNDTDAVWQPKYRKMLCTVDPSYDLSQGILNLLKNAFGRVEIKEIGERL